MNNKIKTILLVAAFLAGAGGMFLVGKYSGLPGVEKGIEREAPSEKGVKKVLYWKAPMDPTYIRNKPGKSPMGMDLVPVYEDEEDSSEPGTVKIDPVTVQNMGVRTARIEKIPLARTIRTIGRVDYDEKRVYSVHTKIDGWIEKLYVDFTGQKVKKDDILLEIYSPQLVSTQEEYLLALKYSDTLEESAPPGTESILELSRRRLELWDVPAHQIKELEETGRIMKTLHIHSPAEGIITEKPVVEGKFVKPGTKLYTIADISKVWVYADIYEYEIAWIGNGQEAEMTLAAYPGRVFRGRVSFIYPFMERKTRTNKVRLEFDNPGRELKPDMYANVTLKSPLGKPALAVPTEAVLLSGERSIVIVARGGGKFSPREVTLGAEAECYYQVLKGLSEGDEVVTAAHFLIDSESRLKEAVTKMLEAKEKGKEAVDDGEDGPMDHDKGQGDMKEMDHGSMDDDEDRAMERETGVHEGMEKMDHTSMEHEEKQPMEHKMEGHGDMKEMDRNSPEGTDTEHKH
jgi:multidrug efflux pump subunit AcrA (membrane-fusion protein)